MSLFSISIHTTLKSGRVFLFFVSFFFWVPDGAVREGSGRVVATGLNRDCASVWPAGGVSEGEREEAGPTQTSRSVLLSEIPD